VADRHAVSAAVLTPAYAYIMLETRTGKPVEKLEYMRVQCRDWAAITPIVERDLRALVRRFSWTVY
jgi:hypothetical protein